MIFGYSGGKCHLPDLEQLKGLTARLQSDPATRNDYYFNLFGWYQDKIKQSYYDILSANGIYSKRVIRTPYIQTTDYLNIYNAMDVSLVPLKENLFNCCKSELKMIECGFFKKACIVQNIYPYKNVITDKNCLKIDNSGQWFKNMKYLIQNAAKVQDLGEQLYQDVRQKYDLNYWNNYRMEVYKNLLK